MKTKHNILNLALAAALVGTLALPAPKAQADDRAGYVIAGALLGGVLGYIINESNDCRDHRPVAVTTAPPAPVVVYQPQPVIVTRPVVYQPQPVIVTRPVVYQPQPVIVTHPVVCRPQPHCPVTVQRMNPHRERPGNRYGYGHDRRPEPGAGHYGSRDGRFGDDNRDHGRR